MEISNVEIPKPDDWHVHLRQMDDLPKYAPVHAQSFGRVLAMPNTLPPLITPEDVAQYRRAAETEAPGLCVHPAFRLMPNMSSAEIELLSKEGVLAGKYYPDGATTNSDKGLKDWKDAEEALSAMEQTGMVLCIHGEDPDAPVLEREEAFLPVFRAIREAFPNLRMILEHVSTEAGVRMVKEDPGPTAATITVQHLLFTVDDLLGGLLKPHLFCKPVLKQNADRRAIQDRVLAGDSRFFFGSDSAPHERGKKESGDAPAGVYSAPVILPALAGWFEEAGAMEKMEPFLCRFGREFYKVPPNPGTVVLEKKSWKVPEQSEGCVPLMAGMVLPWKIREQVGT